MALKTEQAKNNVSVEQSVTGQQHAQGRKKYRDTEQRISSIVERYTDKLTLTIICAVWRITLTSL